MRLSLKAQMCAHPSHRYVFRSEIKASPPHYSNLQTVRSVSPPPPRGVGSLGRWFSVWFREEIPRWIPLGRGAGDWEERWVEMTSGVIWWDGGPDRMTLLASTCARRRGRTCTPSTWNHPADETCRGLCEESVCKPRGSKVSDWSHLATDGVLKHFYRLTNTYSLH